MTLPVFAAAPRIANQLRVAEKSTDAALLAASELLTTMLRARANPEVVCHTGQKALIRIVRAQQALIEGSNEIFRVHDEMSNLAREMGIFDEAGLTPESGLADAPVHQAA